MDKINLARLWDLYHTLLTETQREITDLYFNYDLTVSEIAEGKGVSRQSVSDCVNICKKELLAYEQKLGFAKTLAAAEEHAKKIAVGANAWAQDFIKLHPGYAADIENLKKILNDNTGN